MRRVLGILGVVLLTLTGCIATPNPQGDLFSTKNAYTGDTGDAEVIGQDDFRNRVTSGEITLVSDITIAAQKEAREKQYQADKAFLQSIPNPDPNIQALLIEAAPVTKLESDHPVKLPGGQTVIVSGLGTDLRDAVLDYKESQNVDNALAHYSLSYSLLPDGLKTSATSPDSLRGKSLIEVNAALQKLDALLATPAGAASLRTARLESSNPRISKSQIHSQEALNPGNGTDNNGPCAAPKNYAGAYWFPLKNFVSPVKNQANRGLCWSFTAIGAVESRERVQNGSNPDLSEQFLANKVKQDWDSADYSEGYKADKALNEAVDHNESLLPEIMWTYNPSMSRGPGTDGDDKSFGKSCDGYIGTCSNTTHQSRRRCTTVIFTVCGYSKVNSNGNGVAASRARQVWKNGEGFKLNDLRQFLSQGHVLLASLPVYKGFLNDVGSDGVVRNYAKTHLDASGKEVDGRDGGHVLLFVGFLSNDDLSRFGNTPNIGGGGYFIAKNSWGCLSGDGGYYYFPADYVSQNFNSLHVLEFDNRRSDAWKQDQANPDGNVAPTVQINKNPAQVDLRSSTNIAQFFSISHTTAKSVKLSVTSSRDGVIYNGPWSTDKNVIVPPTLNYSFTSQGTRTLTVVASYGSSLNSQNFVINVVKTPPTITLQSSLVPHQFENYSIFASIFAPSEPDPTKLCSSAKWSVDSPDTVTSDGCTATVLFNATGSRNLRVLVTDSDGASYQQTRTLSVAVPLTNPYPQITHAGLYCGNFLVGSGSTVDLTTGNCGNGPYTASLTVNNPTGEALTYSWQLFITNPDGTLNVLEGATTASSSFSLFKINNTNPRTAQCRINVTVNAPDPARSKSQVVWYGNCTYYQESVK